MGITMNEELLAEMNRLRMADREQRIRALCERTIGWDCPKAAEDIFIVLAFRELELCVIFPTYPEKPYAVMMRNGEEIDREPLPI